MARKPLAPRNPERSRRRLLAAAIRLFAARGFHGVSVDEIVASARLNKRMVYHYFGSKEAIYQAALHEVYRRIEGVEFQALDSGASPRAKLERLLRGYFDFLDANPEFTRLLLWENVEQGRHIGKAGHPLSKNPFIVRFGSTIDEGIRSGELRPDLDVAHLMVHFIGLCFIYHSNRFSLSEGLKIDLGNPNVRARGLQQVIALVFDGISRQSRK